MKMKPIIPAIMLTALCRYAAAQETVSYDTLISHAFKLYTEKQYLKSGQKYAEAFSIPGKGLEDDRYNAACSWSLAGIADSSFIQLFIIAKDSAFRDLNHIMIDPDLKPLRNDSRWNQLLSIVKSNKEKQERNLNKELVAILDTVYREDQQYRQEMDGIQDKYGWESKEMKDLLNTMRLHDSLNLIKVTSIIDEHGWLGPDSIGNSGSSTLFLVIQHADLQTQEKYLPLLKDAVEKRNARPADLALLEDRLAIRHGKRQIYGSQIGRDPETGELYVLPLEDPDNVDARRAKMGLGKFQEYLQNWNLIWDPAAYKKKLPEIEAKQKKK